MSKDVVISYNKRRVGIISAILVVEIWWGLKTLITGVITPIIPSSTPPKPLDDVSILSIAPITLLAIFFLYNYAKILLKKNPFMRITEQFLELEGDDKKRYNWEDIEDINLVSHVSTGKYALIHYYITVTPKGQSQIKLSLSQLDNHDEAICKALQSYSDKARGRLGLPLFKVDPKDESQSTWERVRFWVISFLLYLVLAFLTARYF